MQQRLIWTSCRILSTQWQPLSLSVLLYLGTAFVVLRCHDRGIWKMNDGSGPSRTVWCLSWSTNSHARSLSHHVSVEWSPHFTPCFVYRVYLLLFCYIRLALKKTACGTSVWSREGQTPLMWWLHLSIRPYHFISDCAVWRIFTKFHIDVL